MTNLERIKKMSAKEIAHFIGQFDPYGDVACRAYCKDVCEHRGPDGNCVIPEDEELPCVDLTDEECIVAWLEAEEPGNEIKV